MCLSQRPGLSRGGESNRNRSPEQPQPRQPLLHHPSAPYLSVKRGQGAVLRSRPGCCQQLWGCHTERGYLSCPQHPAELGPEWELQHEEIQETSLRDATLPCLGRRPRSTAPGLTPKTPREMERPAGAWAHLPQQKGQDQAGAAPQCPLPSPVRLLCRDPFPGRAGPGRLHLPQEQRPRAQPVSLAPRRCFLLMLQVSVKAPPAQHTPAVQRCRHSCSPPCCNPFSWQIAS